MGATESHILFLNGNDFSESMLAVGCEDELIVDDIENGFEKIQTFVDEHSGAFIFGYLSYDLKNDKENLESKNKNNCDFAAAHFFVAKHIAKISNQKIEKLIKGNLDVLEQVLEKIQSPSQSIPIEDGIIKPKITKDDYLQSVAAIKRHIQMGDVYEMNFCYEFEASEVEIDPMAVYAKLNKQTQAPFSVFGQLGEQFIISASPERYIKKEGRLITTQPIKGTIKRGATATEDQQLIARLKTNPKDLRENVMIVDLVRNDFSKVADKGSVEVIELCEIHTFKNIHQMISTVEAKVSNIDPVAIIKATFPMGSMTGAPKIRAMQLIEKYESSKRGLYSGTIGYIAPNGDFDFNVVIRTILYNRNSKSLSFSVGGAITDLSVAELEYEETLLKANAMLNSLS